MIFPIGYSNRLILFQIVIQCVSDYFDFFKDFFCGKKTVLYSGSLILICNWLLGAVSLN